MNLKPPFKVTLNDFKGSKAAKKRIEKVLSEQISKAIFPRLMNFEKDMILNGKAKLVL